MSNHGICNVTTFSPNDCLFWHHEAVHFLDLININFTLISVLKATKSINIIKIIKLIWIMKSIKMIKMIKTIKTDHDKPQGQWQEQQQQGRQTNFNNKITSIASTTKKKIGMRKSVQIKETQTTGNDVNVTQHSAIFFRVFFFSLPLFSTLIFHKMDQRWSYSSHAKVREVHHTVL